MIHVPYVAALHNLDALLGALTPYYHLYVNNLLVDPNVELTDFQEADWPNYVPKRSFNWTPAVTVGGRAVSTADLLMWTRGPGGTPRNVYGYFVTDALGGPLLWWEPRDGGPLPMLVAADAYLVRPRLTLREDPTPEV